MIREGFLKGVGFWAAFLAVVIVLALLQMAGLHLPTVGISGR